MKGSSNTSRIIFSVIAGRVPLCGCQFAKEIMRHLSQICRILPSSDSGSAGKPSTLRQRHDKRPLGKQPLEQIDLNLPNDEPALQHKLVCEVVATSSNTERTAIVIKEGEYLGHL